MAYNQLFTPPPINNFKFFVLFQTFLKNSTMKNKCLSANFFRYFKAVFTLFFTAFLLCSCDKYKWAKTFGGISHDVAASIVQTFDGGYAVAGYTASKGTGGWDFWVLKLDDSGNVVWDKTFGDSKDDVANSIVQTSNGGYAVAGYTASKDAGKSGMWILKLDDSGNKVLDKTFGNSKDDGINSMVQTSDGGYAVAGYTESKDAGKSDIWILKLDDSGNVVWDKTFGSGEDDVAKYIIQTSDGGYAVAGWTESKGAGKNDFLVLKLDSSGNKVWDKTFGGGKDDVAKSIVQTSDDGYAVAGGTRSKGAGKSDFWVLKLDGSGNKVWDKTFGGGKDDRAKSIVQTSRWRVCCGR